ncbi:MAG: hypothetical protein M0026_16300 [Nocardiopsaceae bacterium]|nr:hypothetical protein [Nocardiopsaceae bacterium]
MVTTVPRALAVLLVTALMVLGAPLAPAAAALSAQDRSPVIAESGPSPRPYAVAHPRRDMHTAALALSAWGGDHRLSLRDLPDGYSPARPLLPDFGSPWGYVLLPESASPPDVPETFALPLGRAPPLTARV